MVDSIVADTSSGATGRRRRYLTILFADLSDSTYLAETLEAEQYADALNALRQACRTIIPKHGGRIAQLLGDGAVAIFGYPEPQENDGRHATEAALELHAAVQSYRLPASDASRAVLTLHTGIHAGLVLLGEGDVELGRFELLGTVPNIAARLAEAAQRDEILVTAETLGPESYFFETSELRFLSFKGVTAPVAVYRVHGRALVQTRFEASAHRGLAPFIGRTAELGTLAACLEEVRGSTQQRLAIRGSAGLGKTRMAEEFLQRALHGGCEVHRGYCERTLSAEPLQPFLQILRRVFAIGHETSTTQAALAVRTGMSAIDSSLADHERELLRLLSLGEPGAPVDPERVGAALSELLRHLAARRPQILFIDDWQWADDATRQLVRAIGGLADSALLVLLSTRETAANDPDLEAVRVLDLVPFTKDEAAQSMAGFLPTADPFITEEIYTYSGGNPLFIEELCHFAVHDGGHRLLASQQKSAAWLNTLVESRVARLPAEQADLVRVAAVIGNVIPAWLLEMITGYDESHALVHALAAQDLVFPAQPGTLRFKHGITRDAIYNAVGLEQRQAIHGRVAAALLARSGGASQEDAYEALAYHYAGAGQFAEAFRFARLAGGKAMVASALDRARAHYRAALHALDQLGTEHPDIERNWCNVLQELGLVCVFDPLGAGDQLPIFERGVQLATRSGDQDLVARAEYWLGYYCYARGDLRRSIEHSDIALGLARRLENMRLEAQVRAALGQALTSASQYDRALENLDAAIEVKQRFGRGSVHMAVGSAYALACKGVAFGDRGDFKLAHECFAQAKALLRGSDHQVSSSLHAWLGLVFLWQGRWEEAERTAETAVRVAELVRSTHLFSTSSSVGAYARWKQAPTHDAIAKILAATSWIETRGGAFSISLNYGWLADVLAANGEVAQARTYAARAIIRARRWDRFGEAMAHRAAAKMAAADHDFGRADRCIAHALQASSARQSRHEAAVTQLCHAEVSLARGDRATARALLDAAIEEFAAMEMTAHLGLARELCRES
jgi:class 3 adenylate cyclase/tetratricopeptide (TPR) repeat protein